MPKHIKCCALDTNCVIEVLNKIILILILLLCVLLLPLRRHDVDNAIQMSMMEEYILLFNAAQL